DDDRAGSERAAAQGHLAGRVAQQGRRILGRIHVMRSLTVKMVLAFLLTSVAGMALASVFIRQSVTREFDDYVIAQQRTNFIANPGAYYDSTGSWSGVDRWLRARVTGQASGHAPAVVAPPLAPVRIRFGLVDSAGQVVLPFNGYKPGEQASQADIARGAPIISGGQAGGPVITPDRAPFPNVPAEL